MSSFLNKLRSLVIGVMVLAFFLAVTVSSCNSNKGSDNTENAEGQASEGEEHPESEEQASGDEEHPSDGEEHPSDSTATSDSE